MACWIPDGSVGFTVNGAVVTYVDKVGVDNAFNAMWQDGDGVSSGQHYWKIHLPTLEQGAGVGLTSKDYFKQGYGCKAINYLGNLSNGSCFLVGNFGPCPRQGDTIGILTIFDGGRLKVYVDVNEECLGLTFDVPSSIFKSIFPVVSFYGSGTATCIKQTVVPNVTSRLPSTFDGFEGDWKLTKLMENDVELDCVCVPTVKITKIRTDKYHLSARVLNRMWTELTKVDGNWKATGIRTTLIGSDSVLMKFEGTVGCLIKKASKVEVDGSGNLSIESDTMSSTWTRYDSTPAPFVGEPFA